MSIDVKITAVHDYIMFQKNDQTIQIPIRIFQKYILPKLLENEYLQDSHFHKDKDDFPNYSYYHDPVIVAFVDCSKKPIPTEYAVLTRGDEVPTIMSPKVFETFVKPTLVKPKEIENE